MQYWLLNLLLCEALWPCHSVGWPSWPQYSCVSGYTFNPAVQLTLWPGFCLPPWLFCDCWWYSDYCSMIQWLLFSYLLCLLYASIRVTLLFDDSIWEAISDAVFITIHLSTDVIVSDSVCLILLLSVTSVILLMTMLICALSVWHCRCWNLPHWYIRGDYDTFICISFVSDIDDWWCLDSLIHSDVTVFSVFEQNRAMMTLGRRLFSITAIVSFIILRLHPTHCYFGSWQWPVLSRRRVASIVTWYFISLQSCRYRTAPQMRPVTVSLITVSLPLQYSVDTLLTHQTWNKQTCVWQTLQLIIVQWHLLFSCSLICVVPDRAYWPVYF